MRKYSVNVHYDVVIPVEVYANNEDEAIELAEEEAGNKDLSSGDAFGGESCVTDYEPVSDETARSVIFTEVMSGRVEESEDEVMKAIDQYIEENPDCLEDETIEDIVSFIDQDLDEKLGIY